MKQRNLWILAGILLTIGLFGWQNVMELRAEEPRRATVSLEMLLTGEYIVPHLNGWPYYNKPPVFNWLMAGFFELTGSYQEWVARMPSLLSLVVLAFLQFHFVRRFATRKIALLSAFFFITCGEVLLYGAVNTAEIDPFYALVVYLQVMAIFLYYRQKKWWSLFLFSYFLLTLGFLTKGIPSLAFQALTLLAMVFYERKWRWLISLPHLAGIALMLALGGTYFYLYGLQDDVMGFLVRQFKEASQRTGLETNAMDTLWQSLSFPLLMAKLLLPWSLLAVFFFKKGIAHHIKANPLALFAVLFILFNIPLYWFSGDFKPRYYYMFLPFLSFLLAYVYEPHRQPVLAKVVKGIFALTAILLPIGLATLPFIPAMEVVPQLHTRVFICLVITVAAAFLYFKSAHKIAAMVVLMAVARLCLNTIYMPAFENDPQVGHYRALIKEMLKITGDAPIYMTGDAYIFKSEAAIGPISFEEVTLKTAPLMGYKFPYYVTSQNGHVLQFTEEVLPGRYYLVPERMMDQYNKAVLYELVDERTGINYQLIKS